MGRLRARGKAPGGPTGSKNPRAPGDARKTGRPYRLRTQRARAPVKSGGPQARAGRQGRAVSRAPGGTADRQAAHPARASRAVSRDAGGAADAATIWTPARPVSRTPGGATRPRLRRLPPETRFPHSRRRDDSGASRRGAQSLLGRRGAGRSLRIRKARATGGGRRGPGPGPGPSPGPTQILRAAPGGVNSGPGRAGTPASLSRAGRGACVQNANRDCAPPVRRSTIP